MTEDMLAEQAEVFAIYTFFIEANYISSQFNLNITNEIHKVL